MPGDGEGKRLTPEQRIGRELARARKAAGLSQARLGRHLGVSPSLISHVESGSRSLRIDLAPRCDTLLKTGGLLERLCRSLTAPSGPSWYIRWVEEVEPYSRILRSWDPLLVPGLLQTEPYARAVFRNGLAGSSPKEVEDGVSARLRRQVILDGEKPPTLWVLIDEWVLRRPVGGRAVMHDQMQQLLSLVERPTIHVQVVPHDAPCTAGLVSNFVIAEIPDSPTTVSVDSAGKGEVSADHDFVSQIWARYDKIRAEALRPGETVKMIKEARGRWKGGS
ncbi:Helix-turn-helix domain-containing protein [Sinosporangium album]|uniref:Helix-turn-helix domain-containing protein n=1 Tax=Sinosporangium album TaxID=504805 RepID=A0A1G7SJP8_9ACTN|nr:helix-turn-helix transcriptional regulator [Sinosporangium album]SDG22649.1 Helix-turn-helix domain-containing protein [Sinosporangium album]